MFIVFILESNVCVGTSTSAKLVGYKQSPPAFLSLRDGKQMIHGVNFASGGSGILDTTVSDISFIDSVVTVGF